ncbi:MAG: thiamine-phosphate kinase [Deltaproteobacteria bacterium]|nr:thiamine-phosphate kinase [Deltaproteobacteria bacterium]
MTEEDLIAYVTRAFGGGKGRGVEVGIGDDAAVIALGESRAVVTTDALFEGVHFDLRWISAAEVGARAVEVNLSDLAAMGAEPHSLLLAIGARAPLDEELVRTVIDAFASRARDRGCSVVGGNFSRAAELSLTVTAIGTLPRDVPALLRSGARPGDHLLVSGPLGAAALGLRLVAAGLEAAPGARAAVERFRAPRARVDVGRSLSGLATSAIDVSDGLALDLERLARASGVGAVVRIDRVPTIAGHADLARLVGASPVDLALGGGEDYELLFTLPPAESARADTLGATRIGEIVAGAGAIFLDSDGQRASPGAVGFQHF